MRLWEEARGDFESTADLLAALLPPKLRADDRARAALLWIAEVGSNSIGFVHRSRAKET